MSSNKVKISLAWQMMIGLALGVVVGAMVDAELAKTYLQPLGDLFIRLIRMVVVPLARIFHRALSSLLFAGGFFVVAWCSQNATRQAENTLEMPEQQSKI